MNAATFQIGDAVGFHDEETEQDYTGTILSVRPETAACYATALIRWDDDYPDSSVRLAELWRTP